MARAGLSGSSGGWPVPETSRPRMALGQGDPTGGLHADVPEVVCMRMARRSSACGWPRVVPNCQRRKVGAIGVSAGRG